jgi:hypothetical protein
MGVDLLDQKLEWRCIDFVGRGWHFACPGTDSFSARCQNREDNSPLAIRTAEFVHVLVLFAAGFALCYGESNNLTCLPHYRVRPTYDSFPPQSL